MRWHHIWPSSLGREIARTGKIEVVTLRLGDTGVEVSEAEVIEAVTDVFDRTGCSVSLDC